jgi:serine/threonine protein kinase
VIGPGRAGNASGTGAFDGGVKVAIPTTSLSWTRGSILNFPPASVRRSDHKPTTPLLIRSGLSAGPIAQVPTIGRQRTTTAFPDNYGVVRFLLWGFDAGPDVNKGQRVFLNILEPGTLIFRLAQKRPPRRCGRWVHYGEWYADPIGQTIEHYQIVAPLSQERWGGLFKAYDAKFDRTVTLQALDPTWAALNKQGEYTMQTARVALRFRHPGIARVFDLGQTEALTFIVTEFIPGASLAELFETLRSAGQWISLGEAVQLALEIVQALDYAHQRGLVHGGLQPE